MKHSLKITAILLVFFLLAQLLGIVILYQYIDAGKTTEAGKTIFKELPYGERPQMEEETSWISIVISIIIGTILLLILIKLGWMLVWKFWFLIAVITSLTISLGAFLSPEIAFFLALFFSIWKIFKPNFIIQNLTELFLYGGLAVIFVPLLNLWSMSLLLILISIYDAYAVWKSKHMVTMAKSMAHAKVFAGLLIPYSLKKQKVEEQKVTITKGKAGKAVKGKLPAGMLPMKVKTAIIGGGDIGFPLIFAGVILKEFGLAYSLIIPFFAALGLSFLLWKGDENKFYPAMPFISAGCFLGLGLILLWKYLI